MKLPFTAPGTLALAFTCTALGLSHSVHAASTLISDDFESYAVDTDLDVPATSPWHTQDTGIGRLVNVVSSASSFAGATTATQAVQYGDSNDTSNNAFFSYTFASSTTSALTIQFDFKLNTHTAFPTFIVAETAANKGGMFLNLTRDSTPPKMINQINGGGGNDITEFALDTWYRVTLELDAISAAKETYGITVAQSGVATPIYTSTTNFSFRENLADYNSIKFINNTGPSGTSDFLIDNFSITVPEPSSALLGCVGMMALLRRRRA